MTAFRSAWRPHLVGPDVGLIGFNVGLVGVDVGVVGLNVGLGAPDVGFEGGVLPSAASTPLSATLRALRVRSPAAEDRPSAERPS